MVNIIVELSKYLMIIFITMYTYLCFNIFGYYDPDKKKRMLRKQNVLMFTIHMIAFVVMYLETEDIKMFAFYLMQVVLLGSDHSSVYIDLSEGLKAGCQQYVYAAFDRIDYADQAEL